MLYCRAQAVCGGEFYGQRDVSGSPNLPSQHQWLPEQDCDGSVWMLPENNERLYPRQTRLAASSVRNSRRKFHQISLVIIHSWPIVVKKILTTKSIKSEFERVFYFYLTWLFVKCIINRSNGKISMGLNSCKACLIQFRTEML